MFSNSDVTVEEFNDVLRNHDTELVEKEFITIGEEAISKTIEELLQTKSYVKEEITSIKDERSEYNRVKKTMPIQKRLDN